MICNRCLRAAARRTQLLRLPSTQIQPLSTTSRLSSATASSPPTTPQPFSTPLTPSKPDKHSKPPLSTIPAGTRLKGLNLLKGREDPVALKDEEYPSWLWSLVTETSSSADAAGDNEGDLYAKSAKQRRKAAKALRKREALMASQDYEPPVPVQEQSIDLPAGEVGEGGDAVKASIEAGAARTEITRALRRKRRADIKEANFLKGVS